MARLLDQVEAAATVRGYSRHTVAAYRSWVAAYVRFHDLQHPRDLDADAVLGFLADLARDYAPTTVNQAHAALVFLYSSVLRAEPTGMREVPWARGPKRVPTVLTRAEVARVLGALGRHRLLCALLYGTGLRVSEAVSLRVKDLDVASRRLVVRVGKGRKDRITVLPAVLAPRLTAHLEEVRAQHRADCAAGAGWVVLPDTVARKAPKAGRQWIWQWAFPSTRVARLGAPPRVVRYPVHASTVQRALRRAGERVGVTKRVHPHALRHSFATHLLEDGVDIRTLQQLMGHTDVRTTMQYTHVARDALDRVVSPLDRLEWP